MTHEIKVAFQKYHFTSRQERFLSFQAITSLSKLYFEHIQKPGFNRVLFIYSIE